MVPSRTDALLGVRRPGARTGVGTYINYLLAASVIAGSVLAGALARGRRRAEATPSPPVRPEPPPSSEEPPP